MAIDRSAADVLARTIWGEARGEGTAGMELVASVVLNRAAHPRWWGTGIVGVCQQPWQFSCWNAGNANLPKMRAVTQASDPAFASAVSIARGAVAGALADRTFGADSYVATTIRAPEPAVLSLLGGKLP